jgi:hypothetical protein
METVLLLKYKTDIVLKRILLLPLFLLIIFFASCEKESTVLPLTSDNELYRGYLTHSTTQKTENHDPIVNIHTAWQEIEVRFQEDDSVFFKVPNLPLIGFACNEIHNYHDYHGTSGRTEISIENDSLHIFHLQKEGNHLEYLMESWEFTGTKTK